MNPYTSVLATSESDAHFQQHQCCIHHQHSHHCPRLCWPPSVLSQYNAGIQVKRPQSSLAAFGEVSDAVRGDVIETFHNSSKERRAVAATKSNDKNQHLTQSDLYSVCLTAALLLRFVPHARAVCTPFLIENPVSFPFKLSILISYTAFSTTG